MKKRSRMILTAWLFNIRMEASRPCIKCKLFHNFLCDRVNSTRCTKERFKRTFAKIARSFTIAEKAPLLAPFPGLKRRPSKGLLRDCEIFAKVRLKL